MVQFDFFIISKVAMLAVAIFVFYIFLIIFHSAVRAWLEGAVMLLFKAMLSNEMRQLRILTAVTAAPISADLLEQFVLILVRAAPLIALLLAAALIVTTLVGVFARFLEAAASFIGALINDIAQDAAVSMSRNWAVLSSIFVLVLTFNLVGMLPFAFTFTSSLAAPFAISVTVFFAYLFNIIRKHGVTFLAGFLPAGTNVVIAPLIIVIEIISTIAKFISLGVRLFANMFAGHLLLKVFYTIAFYIASSVTLFLGLAEIFVILFLLAITVMELMIAALQAFVMLLLIILYLRESEDFISAH